MPTKQVVHGPTESKGLSGISRNESLNPRYELDNPGPEHFVQIQALCKRVYPFSKPWSLKQLESHQSIFPDGQLVVIDKTNNTVVGLAFSLIISWDDYSPQDNWGDFTSSGFFYNHNPKKGKTLYGAEVMVDPEHRGQGLGKLLYEGRRQIAERYGLKRIRAGARLRGYSKYENQMSPEEYARQVVQGKIFDPTLSFQLAQGFVVLDVARNYLFNDPESLGYAAVIEWMNPGAATDRDWSLQKEGIDAFNEDTYYVAKHLPRELRKLVRKTTFIFGTILKQFEGDDFFQKTESYRKSLKKLRKKKSPKDLEKILKRLENESKQDRMKITHAFSLLLELINSCESAYRTWRLEQKPPPRPLAMKINLKLVLTSHPTEARSQVVVDQLREITHHLLAALHENFEIDELKFRTNLALLWQIPLCKYQKPTVDEEAKYVFSQVLSDPIIDFIVAKKPSYELHLRTWVGGDKDGHPGVDEKVMLDCLGQSRAYLLDSLSRSLDRLSQDMGQYSSARAEPDKVSPQLAQLRKKLDGLRVLKSSDSLRVRRWKTEFLSLKKSAPALFQNHGSTLFIERTYEVFPGLVLPIELREDAEVVGEARQNKGLPIRKMLVQLSRLAAGPEICHYVRGLVLSHCESAEHLKWGCELVDKACNRKLPVIPLFETKEALVHSKTIVTDWLKMPGSNRRAKSHWDSKLEIMLGYSDSAKELGALASRNLIRKCMHRLDKVIRSQGFKPIFFHGSGGSVARGGGSLREQIIWWPDSAVKFPKMTVQGEMIQRTFATKEILNSQALHLCHESRQRRARHVTLKKNPALQGFCDRVEFHYKALTQNSELLQSLLTATPYDYLSVLRIGSRPAKRTTEFSLSSLRAIPWVLCWTQTRTLLPTWWGLGSAWSELTDDQKTELRETFNKDSFFSSFVKMAGFTLAKVEPEIWDLYLKRSGISDQPTVIKNFRKEYDAAIRFVLEVSQASSLLWYREWLEESILLRAPYVHLLNFSQLIAMEKKDEALLRESLVGIASGMLTTG